MRLQIDLEGDRVTAAMRRHVVLMIIAILAASACADGGTEDTKDSVVQGEDRSADRAAPAPDDRPAPDDPSGPAAPAIPTAFHGEWNADRSACGTGLSESRLRISGDRIRFYESVGVVTDVDVESDRVIRVAAEYQGEGETWQDERRFTLAADGGSLTVSDGGDLVRYRCP